MECFGNHLVLGIMHRWRENRFIPRVGRRGPLSYHLVTMSVVRAR